MIPVNLLSVSLFSLSRLAYSELKRDGSYVQMMRRIPVASLLSQHDSTRGVLGMVSMTISRVLVRFALVSIGNWCRV